MTAFEELRKERKALGLKTIATELRNELKAAKTQEERCAVMHKHEICRDLPCDAIEFDDGTVYLQFSDGSLFNATKMYRELDSVREVQS